MKSIKATLLFLLGYKKYLLLTSNLFFRYFQWGWLKKTPAYYNHYFVKKLIQPGQTIIDIGGNLGYYTKIFSALVGPTGKVFTVEPIELYRQVLQKNIGQSTNVTLMPFALGQADGTITMGNPSNNKYRHGLMRVLQQHESQQIATNQLYQVQMKHPLHLFEQIGKIDFIKCDIEGYEIPVIPLLKPLIEKNQPLLQIETDGENKKAILSLLWSLHYQSFYVAKEWIVPVTDSNTRFVGDLLFIPQNKMATYQKYLAP